MPELNTPASAPPRSQPSGHESHERQHERGITLAFVALLMTVILGIAALSIDLGMARLAQQRLGTATDSAALTAAISLARNLNTACPAALNVPTAAQLANSKAGQTLTESAAGATMTSPCDITHSTDHSGFVTVNSQAQVSPAFAPVLGSTGDITINASTTAQWGPPIEVQGATPLVICLDAHSAFRDLVFDPSPPGGPYATPAPSWVPILFEQVAAGPGTGCDGMPNNFGYVDLDGGTAPSLADYEDWIRDGYDGMVTIDENLYTGTNICTDNPACLDFDVLSVTDRQQVVNFHRSLSDAYTKPRIVLVADYVDAATSRAHIVGMVMATTHNLPGSPLFPPGVTMYMPTLVHHRYNFVQGTCCARPAHGYSPSGNTRVVSICGVDPSETGGC